MCRSRLLTPRAAGLHSYQRVHLLVVCGFQPLDVSAAGEHGSSRRWPRIDSEVEQIKRHISQVSTLPLGSGTVYSLRRNDTRFIPKHLLHLHI